MTGAAIVATAAFLTLLLATNILRLILNILTRYWSQLFTIYQPDQNNICPLMNFICFRS